MTAWIERGGPLMWPLLLLSLLAVTLIVERTLFWLREPKQAPRARLDAQKKAQSVSNTCDVDLELVLDFEQQRLERGMATLDTIVAAAPMLGILGTVLGVIVAFDSLASHSSPDPMVVTGGIAQALITTATGLVVTLCVLFPQGYFRTRVRDRLCELEAEARRLSSLEPK